MGHIGSDFPTFDTSGMEQTVPPWERAHGPVTYLETGRQVLTLIEAELTKKGVEILVVPSHYCETMVEPFLRKGWSVFRGEPSPNLEMLPPSDWENLLEQGPKIAVLSAAYFGRPPSERHAQLVREARAAGAAVIEDETHRVFEPGGVEADYAFASLRKLLPLGDGAYVHARTPLSKIEQLDRSPGGRWKAMDLETSIGFQAARPRYVAEEAEFATEGRMRRISERSEEVMRRLPYEDLALRRRSNFHALHEAFGKTGDLQRFMDRHEGVPSHYVVEVDDPRSCQKALAGVDIFCPVHWGRPQEEISSEWRENLLSIPLDHRYGTDQMRELASVVQALHRDEKEEWNS